MVSLEVKLMKCHPEEGRPEPLRDILVFCAEVRTVQGTVGAELRLWVSRDVGT